MDRPAKETQPVMVDRSMGSMIDAAVEYAGAGLRVFPLWGVRSDGSCECGDGASCNSTGKHPHSRLVPRGLLDASDDPERVRAWWRQVPTANVAIATGGEFFVLDVDAHGDVDGMASLLDVRGDQEWPQTTHCGTGGGGHHFWFGKDHDVAVRNQQGLRVGDRRVAGLDVRGEGGYVVAPPSRHASGSAYSWATGFELVVAAPPWLLAIVASGEVAKPDTTPTPATPTARAVPSGEVEQVRSALLLISPCEDRESWVERVSMPLHDHFGGSDEGFAIWHEWCRRGQGLTTPNGNPAYGGEPECRRVWASFSTGKRNPLGIATFWQHARRHGWQPRTEPNGNGNGAPPPITAGAEQELEPWREPEAIWRPGAPPRLDFAAAYPAGLEWLRDLVCGIGDLQQVDPAFPALMSIGMVAGAAGRLYQLRLDGTGWVEPMALWVICALESGGGKSPVFRPLVRPFHAWERDVDAEQQQEVARWEARMDAARGMVAHAQSVVRKRAKQMEENPFARNEVGRQLSTAREGLAEAERERPQSRKLLAGSLTTPALVEFLMRHRERCLIVDPEGSVFQHALSGRTDSEKDLDPWLKSYSCEPIKQNRVGDRRNGPLERHVSAPTLSMALCTQIGALDLFRDKYAESRGFLARFLAATFDHDLPTSPVVLGDLPDGVEERWAGAVHRLLAQTVPDSPAEILLAGEGREMFLDWAQRWLDVAREDPQADLGRPAGYGTPVGAKLRSGALRLMLLFHVLLEGDGAAEAPVRPAVVRAVLDGWMPFLRAALERTLVVIRDDPAGRLAERVLGYLWRHHVGEFSRADAKSNLSDGKVTRVDDLNPALSMLADAGWIQPLDKPRFRGPGTVPASSRYLVHPDFREHYGPLRERG